MSYIVMIVHGFFGYLFIYVLIYLLVLDLSSILTVIVTYVDRYYEFQLENSFMDSGIITWN